MTPIFRRRSASAYDPETLTMLRESHLLLVPQHIGVDRVDELVGTRVDNSHLKDEGSVRLGRHSALVGPFEVEVEDAIQAKVPTPWRVAYAVQAPPERDPAGFEDMFDPVQQAQWMRAFPGGPPYREEGDALGLAMSLARSIGGAVRVAGTNVVLTPDPDKLVDLVVWSPYWVPHERMLDLLRPALPGAHVDLSGVVWGGPREHERPWELPLDDPQIDDYEVGLGEEDKAVIDAVADATDIVAISSDDTLDGYAVQGDEGVEVQVQVEEVAPAWIRERLGPLLATPDVPLVTYFVRWWPRDESLLGLEEPPAEHIEQRERIRPWIGASARVVAEATDGLVVNSDGFPLDRYEL